MTTLPNTVLEYSRYAAQEFLQTVVFVDDRIYEPKSGSVAVPKDIVAPKKRKQVTKSAANTTDIPDDELGNTSEDDHYSPHDIVTSFAKKQIVCSLYQPRKGASVSPSSDIFPLCRAADIVIVDWDLYGDKGKDALKLICGLIKQAVEDVPEQLRLILVYTNEQNLFAIANELYQKVDETLGEELEPQQEEGGLAFHTTNSRVSILGKSGRERADTHPDHIVEEKDLANTAINEFSKLASGILHAATLLGLAKIKKNSKKILSKFNESLDPAFFTHMAMCLPKEDATTHLIPLLVSEIEAVLEDALPSPLMSPKLIKDWCENKWEPGAHFKDIVVGCKDNNIRHIAASLCVEGFAATKEKFNGVPKLNNNNNARKAAKLLLGSPNDISNHIFSHLMSSRTFYDENPKSLKLGTIVYNKRDEKYLLCIQPVCDGVRLDADRVFVFVELIKTGPEIGNQASHIVVGERSDITELFYQAKSYQCYVAKFSPDPHCKKVITKENKYKETAFIDKSKKTYIWLGQLKTSHAQRAVETFSSDLSRVGLTESEWLRLLARK